MAQPGGSVDDPYVLDSQRNYGYGGVRSLGLNGGWGRFTYGQTNQTFSTSYVTGSHSAKVGVQYLWGTQGNDYRFPESTRDQTYIFFGRTPSAVVRYVTPVLTQTRQNKLGFFAQDQITLRQLTLNLGVRWDYLKGSAPAIDAPAGVWVPARHFDAADNIPNWKDWSPRVGAAYDLFGNGKTAIKGAVGRYVAFQNNAGIISANAPASRLSLTDQRSWADNGDLHRAGERTRTVHKRQFRNAGCRNHLCAGPSDGQSAVQLAGVAAGPAGYWSGDSRSTSAISVRGTGTKS